MLQPSRKPDDNDDMSTFNFDMSQAPMIVVEYPDSFLIEDYYTLFARYRDLCAQHERIAWVIDFRRFNPVTAPPEFRKQAAACFAESREVLIRSTVCEARVVDNLAARSVLIAFDWLTGTKWPTKNVGHREAAERWCRDQLLR
jgi:hypothetical protein